MCKIEKGIYEGYYWMSDEEEPKVLVNESFDRELKDRENPFVIEAQLYSKEKNVSYSVKYVDGQYRVSKYEISINDLKEAKDFLAHRMGKDTKLKFVQRWKEVEDDFCEGMSVLEPAEFVFVGFNYKEK